ncbi:MAG: hypothetical protein ACP5HG_16670, partial [Anaerolineae bacterium]
VVETRRCRVSGGAASPGAWAASNQSHRLRRRWPVRETGHRPVSTAPVVVVETRRCRVSGGAASPGAGAASKQRHWLRWRFRVRETGYQPVSTTGATASC